MQYRIISFVFMLAAVLAAVSAQIPNGTWVYIPDASWNFIEAYTVRKTGACRIIRSVDHQGLISFHYQQGSFQETGEGLVFTPDVTYILVEGEGGFSQSSHTRASNQVISDVHVLSSSRIDMGGIPYVSSQQVIDSVLNSPDQIKRNFVSLINLTVFTLQSQIDGFGGDGMITYWRNPKSVQGFSGSAEVSMRSSGRVMLIYPRLPVWLDMKFQSYSVFDGITLTGVQTTYSTNRRGDGYLYGMLEIEGIGTLVYGKESGEDSVIIRDGNIAEGSMLAAVKGRTYRIDASRK